MAERLSDLVIAWQKTHGRHHLPWQKTPPDPYAVWVSEVMLQQTQVKTVISYFHRMMDAFPTIEDLAKAEIDQVFALWAGLGYYRRARHLHQAAQKIETDHQGRMPNQENQLLELPGIGRSTAGAILALGFHQPTPILDGNVKRVFARFFAIEGQGSAFERTLWKIAEQEVPQTSPEIYTQGLMDLGAMVCTPKSPHCTLCPLQTRCMAYQKQLTHCLPSKKQKKVKPRKSIHVLILKKDTHILLLPKPNQGIWSGLWSLPEWPNDEDLYHFFQNDDSKKYPIQTLSHTFTHYHLDLVCHTLETQEDLSHLFAYAQWFHEDNLPALPSPIRKLVTQHGQSHTSSL